MRRHGVQQLIDWGAAAFLLMALGGPAAEPSPADPIQFAQVTIREQVLIRFRSLRPQAPTPAAPPIEWKESRGPKCVPMRLIAGAALVSQNSVDLMLKDNRRVRAKLQKSCPAIDYYRGFYIRPSEDGEICADRDIIRSRMGGQCQIDGFKTLKAKKPD